MHIDLVDLREISNRTGTNVNHVVAWTREPTFPEPTSLSIGEIWVWGPVRQWLTRMGCRTDADLKRTY